MRAVCFFLVLCTLHVASAAESLPQLDDAEQDKQGVVWAVSRQDQGRLHTFDGHDWNTIPVSFKTQRLSTPLRLLRLPDGAIACLWKVDDDHLAISTHAGTESKLVTVFPSKIPEVPGISPCLFFDSHGQFWITGSSGEIHHVDKDGKAAQREFKYVTSVAAVNPIQSDNSTPNASPRQVNTGDIQTVEDGKGRIWAWSHALAVDASSMENVVIFDGDKVEDRAKFAGISSAAFSAVLKKDEKHMWVAVRAEGLFEVDIDTFKAVPVKPETGTGPITLAGVQLIFPVGSDWYVVDDGTHHKSDLWRLRAGKWTQLISKMDGFNREPVVFSSRPWLATEKGLVIRAFDAAPPWFISETAPPMHLDWQGGFEVGDARRIFQLADGSLFTIGSKGQVFHGVVAMPPKPPVRARVTEVQIQALPIFSRNGTVSTGFPTRSPRK